MMMIASAVRVGVITAAIQPGRGRPRQPERLSTAAALCGSLCMDGG
jgi:hypothetical protein